MNDTINVPRCPDCGLHDMPQMGHYCPARTERAKLRRERIATAVLAGFAEGVNVSGDDVAQSSAVEAVRWADALIEELDRR